MGSAPAGSTGVVAEEAARSSEHTDATTGAGPERKGFVALISGWSGEAALVRLLSAGGAVRIVGQVLADPVRQPAHHLRRSLRAAAAGGRAGGVLVQPHHLWLRNQVDADGFVADLVADGILVLSLHRSSHIDRGLSRALSGPCAEILPVGPQVVDPGEVAVFATEDEFAASWFATVVPDGDLRFVFEDDLLTPEARERTFARLAERLGLPRSEPPPERDLPVHEALWRRVADPDALARGLALIGGDAGG